MPGKSSNQLLSLLADLDVPTPKDFDPEDERPVDSDEEDHSDGSAEDDGQNAREHYAAVGKSKLRKPEQPSLGPRYTGSRVSRDAALNSDEDNDDDPFAKRFDDEEGDEDSEDAADEDDVSGEDDLEDEEDDDLDGMDSEGDEDDSEGSQSADEADETAIRPILDKSLTTDSSILRKAQAAQQETAAAALSRGAQEEKAKGRAIQKQRAAFDALLSVRIKLQKALIGGNTIAALAQTATETPSMTDDLENAFQAAETAAYSLWSSLTSLREQLHTTRAGSKRSHAEYSLDSSTADLWAHTQSQNSLSTATTDATLEKWFAKSHIISSSADQRNKLSKSTAPTSAKSILTSVLADRAHLIKRARTPRSCAPLQLSRRTATTETDATVYDDADMYAVLLTTLLEQKGSSAVVAVGQAPHAIRREAKTRRVVDTKASKGRKLRYTVHEKLLNYMAPRDTGVWEDRQADELFGSLFGQRMALDENEVESEQEQEDDEVTAEAGLLFGR